MAIIIENDSKNLNDKRLLERVIDLGGMFKDMRFTEDSLTGEYINDIKPDVFFNFDYHHFVYRVENKEKCYGMFDEDTKTLSISTSALVRDDIILHEMIHLHEHIINTLHSSIFHDLIIWTLYSSLKNRIDDLDDYITDHLYEVMDDCDNSKESHSLLFLLKSFDCDLRHGYMLGTVLFSE